MENKNKINLNKIKSKIIILLIIILLSIYPLGRALIFIINQTENTKELNSALCVAKSISTEFENSGDVNSSLDSVLGATKYEYSVGTDEISINLDNKIKPCKDKNKYLLNLKSNIKKSNFGTFYNLNIIISSENKEILNFPVSTYKINMEDKNEK